MAQIKQHDVNPIQLVVTQTVSVFCGRMSRCHVYQRNNERVGVLRFCAQNQLKMRIR